MLHGFKRLRPAKTQEEIDAEKVLADVEAGKYGPPVKEKPKEEPTKPMVKPVEDLTDDPDPVIAAEARRKKGYKKLIP